MIDGTPVKVEMRAGFLSLCDLPDGYDSRTRLTTAGSALLIVHPEMPPLLIIGGKLRTIESVVTELDALRNQDWDALKASRMKPSTVLGGG